MQIFFNLYNSRLRIFNGGLDSVVHLYLVSSYEIGLLAGLQGWTRIFFLRGEAGPGKAKKQGGAGKESKSAGQGGAGHTSAD